MGTKSEVGLSTTGHEEKYVRWWMGQQEERRDEQLEIGGINLFVSKNVFSPNPESTNSVDLILRNFPDVKEKRVLDIGTGTGILAIKAALKGAREVIATDVTESAIENAEKNVNVNGVEKVVRVTNQERFEDIKGSFDVIMMNIIFAHSPRDPETKERMRTESLGLHHRLVNALPQLLTSNGKLILGFASFGDIETLKEILELGGFDISVISENKFGVNWYVISVRLGLM